MSGSTIDDPLSDTYNKLGCSISPLEKNSDDYDMIVKYLEKTYEPVKVGDMVRLEFCFLSVLLTTGSMWIISRVFPSYELQEYGVSVQNIFVVEPSACPSYEDIIKLPNKVLLWCGKKLYDKISCYD